MKNEPDLFTSSMSGDKLTRILYLDTETTGADPESARVCEIGMILSTYRDFQRLPGEDIQYQSFVQPPQPVPPEASAVHHITNEMLEGKPSVSEISDEIAEFVSKADYFSAHNILYDLTILKRELPNIFGPVPPDRYMDSLRLARHVWPLIPSHALQALRYRFKLDSSLQGDAHRALFDTRLVRSLVEHVVDSGLVEATDWEQLVSFTQSPLEIKVFSFGKYRGKLVEDIAAQDRDYVMWLLKQEWVPKDYPDLYHTMLEKTSAGDRVK